MPPDPEVSDSRIGRRFKLRELHILSAVAQFGSMAKAASHLAITQPAVSQAISELEAEVRVPLLERNPHGVMLTIYGQALLRRGVEAFDALKQGLRDIQYLADPDSGEICIGCPESLAAGFLPAIMDRYSRRHPRVVFQIVEANSASSEFRELRDRNVDLMLGRFSKPIADIDDVNVEFLFDDPLLVVAGKNNPLARRTKIELAELVDARWIMAPSNNIVRSLFVQAFRARGLNPPQVQVASTSMHVRMHLLATGRFLTVLASSLLYHNADRWSLKVLPIDLGAQQLPVGIATLKNRVPNPAVKSFIEEASIVAKSAIRPATMARRV